MDIWTEKTITLFCCSQPECMKEYKSRFNLSRHMQLCHLEKKLFECKICKKSLSSKHVLKEHMFKHSRSKPYKCKVCKKPFRHYSLLCLHRRKHNPAYINALEKEIEI